LKPPRAAITTNEPIQSKLDYRLDLAVSIDMLAWVTKPVFLFLWDLEVTWFEPKNTKKPAVWRWFNRQWIHSKMMFDRNYTAMRTHVRLSVHLSALLITWVTWWDG
jgi:hypothetical protein